MNQKLNFSLIIFSIIFVISVNLCDAGKPPKHDKDKHSGSFKNDQQQHDHKNLTVFHKNHTAIHNSNGDHALHNNTQPGWSMPNNQNQQHTAENTQGYAIQPHPHVHPDQTHQYYQHTRSDQSHNAGPSALGAGMGGLAVGAVGGYLLSNALNSDDSDEKNNDTTITETTLTTLAQVTGSSTVPEGSTVSENSSMPGSSTESTSVATAESTLPVLEVKLGNLSVTSEISPSTTEKPTGSESSSTTPVETLKLVLFLILFSSTVHQITDCLYFIF